VSTNSFTVSELGSRVIREIERGIVGKRTLLEKMMAAILAEGK
jgi:hypothetical protein